MNLPRGVAIREVGPRDGLQAEAPVPVAERVAIIEALADAGLACIEAVSFVSEKAVPAMAGAAEVMARLRRRDGVAYVALVPNRRGAEMALDAGVDGLTVTVSASETYSEKNTRRSIDESMTAVDEITTLVGGRVPIDVVVSCAFGSPYEGDLDPDDVAALCHRVWDAGATALTLADTTGVATPRRVDDLLDVVGTDVGLHLHETRRTGLVNAYAALLRGVARFDTATGGLGGSPFAAGASGNLATEDLVHLLDDIGVATGVDVEALLNVGATLERVLGHPVASGLAKAGPRGRLAGDA